MRKVLYAPGHGAGWASWEGSKELQKFMLFYQPFIEYIESGNTLPECRNPDKWTPEEVDKLIPVIRDFVAECLLRFNKVPYLGALPQLQVETVYGAFRINEYAGNERIIDLGEDSEYF